MMLAGLAFAVQMQAAEQAGKQRQAAEQAAVSDRATEEANKAAAAQNGGQKIEAGVQVRSMVVMPPPTSGASCLTLWQPCRAGQDCFAFSYIHRQQHCCSSFSHP